jgi:hypothetical protein
MKLIWKSPAVKSLFKLDLWRRENGWEPISSLLVDNIHIYFMKQDPTIYVLGRRVSIKGLPVNMRMALVSVGKSDPYKVFFRQTKINIEIYLIRHPYQKSLL